ncbi:MAG: undecaprenyl-phosphate glucose phosphotransferase [Gammaproteobacteria bacterium]|nr:undecaprenyl-phosphate glucose phosphotransferase [Gammaproteobacteria bacterium]
MTKQTGMLLVILISFLLAYMLRFGYTAPSQNYLTTLLLTLIISSIILPATGAFRSEFRWAFLRKTRRLIAGWALVVTTLVTVAAMFKVTSDYSRIWFTYWVVLGGLGLFISQLIEHGWQVHRKRHSKIVRRLVLAGGGSNGRRVERRILEDSDGGLQLAARFGDDWTGENVFPIKQLAGFVMSEHINEVWIAAPWEDRELLELALSALNESVVDVYVIPDLHQYRLLNQGVVEWGGIPVINLSGTPMTGAEQRIKSVFDRVVSFLLVVLLSPLLIVIALLVRFSGPGPVLFRQKRQGIGGESIEIFKFRSMNLHEELVGEVDQATQDDERVTAVGRILRRNSLDELPQLLNVVLGEMSLVGPRPHPIGLNDAFKTRIPKYMLRHKVKPGITGWAQVNGFRGITDTDEKMALRIEHDLWYIQNWSLWLDIRILLQTPLAMIHRNAF